MGRTLLLIAAFFVSTGLAARQAAAEDQSSYFLPAFDRPAPQDRSTPSPDLLSPVSNSLIHYFDAQTQPSTSSPERPYVGGRGMVTLDGMTGMFIDPTSGTLPQGDLTIQYCLYINNLYGHHFNDNNHVVGHGIMADYGVTDWLDVGLFGEIALIPGADTRWFNEAAAIGGPFARIRLLKEDQWWPEISIGGEYFDGTLLGERTIAKREGFIAASKGFDIDPDGFLRSIRGHVGYRYISRPQASGGPFPGDREYVYGGVEAGLPYSLYLIGELSSHNIVYPHASNHLPWAAGLQWRPNAVLGISLAYLDPEDHQLGLVNGLWFGFGFNFKF